MTLEETLPSLLYTANWSAATGYLAAPLWHTWSLAVEEQFYLMWPVVLLVARRPVWLVIAVIVGTSIASVMASPHTLVEGWGDWPARLGLPFLASG